MFTSKSTFLLITTIALLAIAWNTDITMVYVFFTIAFVIFVLSFMHLRFNIPRISVSRDVDETAYEGEILNVKLNIRNKRPLGISFFEIIDRFQGGHPGEEDVSLFILQMDAKENEKISYIAACYKRGLWRFGPIFIVSQDALGFFKTRRRLNVFSEILVYPAMFRIFAFPPLATGSVSWLGVETARISGDSHEFFGVREYHHGDAMSRIHWPLTARHNKLVVKQFERNAIEEVTIVLDLKKGHDIGSGKETTLEYAVKIAASLVRYLLNEGSFVQMLGYGKEAMMIPFGKGVSHMYKILDALAKVQADGNFSLRQALDEASFITPHRSTLIAILLDNDIDSLMSLVQFKVKGIKLILIVLATSTFGQVEEKEYLDAEAARRFDETLVGLEAHIYRILKGDDLERKFEAA